MLPLSDNFFWGGGRDLRRVHEFFYYFFLFIKAKTRPKIIFFPKGKIPCFERLIMLDKSDERERDINLGKTGSKLEELFLNFRKICKEILVLTWGLNT